MLEYGIAGNGMPMGKADIGGGYFVVDGALYQYMGSVATYNDLLALDTTDFKPGYAYDVQEDGMDYSWTGTEWNSLGTHTDLSNYYTKDETYSKGEVDTYLDAKADDTDLANYYPKDETYNKAQVDSLIPDVSTLATKTELADGLAGKEDAFTTDTPLLIAPVSSAVNMSIVNGALTQTATPASGLGRAIRPSNAGEQQTASSFLKAIGGSSVASMDDFFAGGYIDIPLPTTGSFTITAGKPSSYAPNSFVFGKGTGNNFIPIGLMQAGTGTGYALTYQGINLNMSDTFSIVPYSNLAVIQFTSTPSVAGNVYRRASDVESNLGCTAVSIDKTNTSSYVIDYTYSYNYNSATANQWLYQTVTYQPYIDRINEITTLRLFIGTSDYNASTLTTYDISKVGVYSYGGSLYNISYSDLGNNLVNIQQLIEGSNHLQLNIGTGLAVQNGALVNTNPTASTTDQNYNATSTNAQSGTAVAEAISTKADSSDLTTLSNTVSGLSGSVSNLTTAVENKQDVLTANDPLSISTYAKSNLNGMVYTQDTTGVYTDSNNLNDSHLTFYNVGNYQASPSYYASMGYFSSSYYTPPSTTFKAACEAVGYIDIPYQIGQVASIGYSPVDTPQALFGKMTNAGFIPIAKFSSSSLEVNMSDIIDANISMEATSNYTLGITTSLNIQRITAGSTPQQGYSNQGSDDIVQLVLDSGIMKCRFATTNSNDTRWRLFNNMQTTDASIIARLSEINTVRVMPYYNHGQNQSAPIAVAKIGVRDYNGLIDYDTVTYDSNFGENLFDISGVQAYNYLDLNIGAGLAVQNGNLVSTTEDELYYKAGDTFSVDANIYPVGGCTNDKMSVLFTLVLPKRLDNIQTITLAGTNTYIYQDGNRYLLDFSDANTIVTFNKAGANLLAVGFGSNVEIVPTGRAGIYVGWTSSMVLTFS